MSIGQARQVLGLAPGAEAADLARAYRVAVKAAHPDREGGDADRLRQVIEAHQLLKTLAEARLAFAPAVRPAPVRPARPAPRVLRLSISVAEALFGGERRIEVEPGRQLDVRLPEGLRPGESLRLAGAGKDGGDVLVRILGAVEPGLTLRGQDVWFDVAAPADKVVEGAPLEVETPRGRRALTAPPGVQSGTLIRLRGEGLPARGRHPAGDLILRLTLTGVDESERVSQRKLRRFSARWAA